MRAAIRDLGKLEKLAMERFESTFLLLAVKPVFSVGRVMAEMEARAFTDSKKIIELEDEVQKQRLENSALKALQWEYDKLLRIK
jgi:cell division protein FtsL